MSAEDQLGYRQLLAFWNGDQHELGCDADYAIVARVAAAGVRLGADTVAWLQHEEYCDWGGETAFGFHDAILSATAQKAVLPPDVLYELRTMLNLRLDLTGHPAWKRMWRQCDEALRLLEAGL